MYNLGIDLGGTNVAAGVVDKDYKIVSKYSVPTDASKGIDCIIDNIAAAANGAIKEAGLKLSDINSIGIGSPGSINAKTGVVDFAANLGFDHTPLADLVSAKMGGIAVHVENDANVAAYAEFVAGSAKGVENSVTVTLGTGVGGGIIINGKVYSGFNNKGGELGHIVIERDGWQCTCGRRGCWEAYASVSGLIRLTKQEMQSDKTSAMWAECGGDIDKVNGLTSFNAMRRGDPAGMYVVRSYLKSVAVGIVDVINILQPEVLCIGGGISKEGDTLLIPVREMVKNELFTRNSDATTEIRIAKLGNDAGIIGAALLGC